MIEAITLANFQGHQDSVFKLDPGINVITGDSDSGKSSVIRALYWLIYNRPTGGADVFRNRHVDPKELISVAVLLHDFMPDEPPRSALVARYRKGSENGYDVMGDKLKAIRTDVPAEVVGLLNFSDHNIQPQHNPYFLLADSPGEVARHLNDVCGLEIIDQCLGIANRLINQNSQDIKATERNIQQTQADLLAYDDLEAREKDVGRLERKQGHLVDTQARIRTLTGLLNTRKGLIEDIAAVDSLLEAESEVDALMAKIEEQKALQARITRLQDLLDERTRLDTEVRRKEASLGELETSLHSLMDGLGVCPLCNQKIGGKNAN